MVTSSKFTPDDVWHVAWAYLKKLVGKHNPNSAMQGSLMAELADLGVVDERENKRVLSNKKSTSRQLVTEAAYLTRAFFARVTEVNESQLRVPKPMLDAAALSARKGADYNSKLQRGRDEYFPFGLKSYSQMIHVKCMRLVNLSESGEPNFESVRDTCLDLINYASFLAEAMDEGKLS